MALQTSAADQVFPPFLHFHSIKSLSCDGAAKLEVLHAGNANYFSTAQIMLPPALANPKRSAGYQAYAKPWPAGDGAAQLQTCIPQALSLSRIPLNYLSFLLLHAKNHSKYSPDTKPPLPKPWIVVVGIQRLSHMDKTYAKRHLIIIFSLFVRNFASKSKFSPSFPKYCLPVPCLNSLLPKG